jgi:DNA-binding IclR family transcriptional regulator
LADDAALRTPRQPDDAGAAAHPGCQTLLRGLDVIETIAQSPLGLVELAAELGLNRSTAHRLASALVSRGYLNHRSPRGYSMGPKLLELGHLASVSNDLALVARPHLQALAQGAGDAVNLAVRDGDAARFVDQLPGGRRVEIRPCIGELRPIRATGLGKALVLDETEARWRDLYRLEGPATQGAPDEEQWIAWMRDYAKRGVAFDLEENEDRIRCVAAPVRGANGKIVAAISVSGAAQYMDDARMNTLVEDVRGAADAIGRDLGWNGKPAKR